MTSLRNAALLSAIGCVPLAGCYTAPKAPQAVVSASLYPPGVNAAQSGIFTDPANPCCWLGRDASFRISVPPDASHVVLTVWTPSDIPKLRRSHQHITVTVDKRTASFTKIPIGTKVLEVRIPPSAAERSAEVRMHMAVTFVPNEELNNGDGRTLSIYLKSVQAW